MTTSPLGGAAVLSRPPARPVAAPPSAVNAKSQASSAAKPRDPDTLSLEKLFGIADQIQALCITRKTGEIRVTNVVGPARLNIVDGELVDAQFGSRGGLEAAIALINLRSPETGIVRCDRSIPRTIHLSCVHVLLEAACRKDETTLDALQPPAIETMPLRSTLRIVLPTGAAEYPLNQGLTLVGRLPVNDIVIPDTCISRRHAGIKIATTGTTLRDLESSNGTFVNGLRITEADLTGPCELRFGMVRAEYLPAS
ncbi:FHA domain-containing protein [bacterium]|nr:FHA domain-containing protein [bacterium]